MKILVTGSAGFIGSQLAKRLRDKQHDVRGVDNFNDHLYDPGLKMKRVEAFDLDTSVFDLRDRARVNTEVFSFQPDLVIHLAAHAGVRDSYGKERGYHENNIDGTQNLIEACKALPNSPRVIYASTSCIYGAVKELPWVEDNVYGKQLNAYGYTKWTNECQFAISGLRNVGLRFFTVYGPWGRPDMALFDFTKKILDNSPITVYNDGNMKRDFTYVDDILDGIELVIANEDMPDTEVFNIGRGEQVNLMDFVHTIESCVGKEALIEYAPKHPADTVETWSNTEKLGKLGYQPKISITEGVSKFYDWYSEFYGV